MSLRILAFCGSLRRISMNAALLRAAARLAPAGMTLEICALGELPLFNPDLEADLPAPVRRLHADLDASAALLIAGPEYAHGVSGALKNALDWLVSYEGFVGKRVAIFNASPASVHAHAALREILTTMSARIVEPACLSLPLRGLRLDDAGMVASVHAPAIRAALSELGAGA